jgi:HK97 family phage prohead protease
MFLRTQEGVKAVGSRSALLEFLTGVSGKGGQVREDIELVAPVPFRLSTEEGETSNGVAAVPDGITWTFSTFELDRFKERIDPAGWDFKRYRDNPVIEWAHRYDIPAIGRAEHIYTDEKGLHGSIVFNSKDYDPFGWAIGERVKAGVIRAGSVGFRPVEIEIPSKENDKDGTMLIFRKQELLEFSICNVPANPWALVKPLDLTKTIAAGKPEMTQDLCSPSFWGNIINNFEGV